MEVKENSFKRTTLSQRKDLSWKKSYVKGAIWRKEKGGGKNWPRKGENGDLARIIEALMICGGARRGGQIYKKDCVAGFRNKEVLSGDEMEKGAEKSGGR